jgi:hypothetical protein
MAILLAYADESEQRLVFRTLDWQWHRWPSSFRLDAVLECCSKTWSLPPSTASLPNQQ